MVVEREVRGCVALLTEGRNRPFDSYIVDREHERKMSRLVRLGWTGTQVAAFVKRELVKYPVVENPPGLLNGLLVKAFA